MSCLCRYRTISSSESLSALSEALQDFPEQAVVWLPVADLSDYEEQNESLYRPMKLVCSVADLQDMEKRLIESKRAGRSIYMVMCDQIAIAAELRPVSFRISPWKTCLAAAVQFVCTSRDWWNEVKTEERLKLD